MAIQREVKRNPYFDEKYIKQAIIPWWKEILLWFLPTYVAFDTGLDGENVVMFYKSFRGVVYVVGQEKLPKLSNLK